MKKNLLFVMACVLGLFGTVNAQEPEQPKADSTYLLCERFENYEVGDKIAEKGADYWTTWSGTEGGSEDGVIAADTAGNKYAHFKKGNDQVIFLGDYSLGCYEVEYDMYIPKGKSAYFNLLHDFCGASSTWAMESYLHMTSVGNQSAGKGAINVADENIVGFECVYDAWTHLRFVVDIDRDTIEFYYTLPNAEEAKIVEWQWSQSGLQEGWINRHLDAMNFYPSIATSEFYVDNITVKKVSGETAPKLSIESDIKAGAMVDDVASIEITFENTGTSVADYAAWIDYGVSESGNQVTFVNYDNDLSDSTTVVGMSFEEPTLVEIGAMYPASSYSSSVAGTRITHVSYPFTQISENSGLSILEGSDVVFRIYRQGYNGQPGECLASKTIPYSSLKAGEFAVAKLDEPVYLSGFDVWATVSFIQPVSTQSKPQMPLIFDGIAANTSPYGGFVRLDNVGPFFSMQEIFGKPYGNLHIRITCAGDPVLGGWAEIEQVDGTLMIGETATMNINFNTFGLEDGKTYEAKLVLSIDNVEELLETPLTLRIWGEDVEEVLSNSYNIYPNPTTGMVTVEGENINYVAVYNSLGQLVKVVKTQNNVVDMSAYENGVYFFNVVDNAGQNSVQRVVVAK